MQTGKDPYSCISASMSESGDTLVDPEGTGVLLSMVDLSWSLAVSHRSCSKVFLRAGIVGLSGCGIPGNIESDSTRTGCGVW